MYVANKKPGAPGRGGGTNAKEQTQAQAKVGREKGLWWVGNTIMSSETYPPFAKDLGGNESRKDLTDYVALFTLFFNWWNGGHSGGLYWQPG
jgi:hypothetical protein